MNTKEIGLVTVKGANTFKVQTKPLVGDNNWKTEAQVPTEAHAKYLAGEFLDGKRFVRVKGETRHIIIR